jgi:Domain of unknown function DUF11
MRVARFGYLRLAFAIGGALALVMPGAAPAATQGPAPAPRSFKVTISPEYTTAGQPTTFKVTVVNTSTQDTTLGSVKVTPPSGFTPPQPAPGAPLRRKTKVQNRTLSVSRLSLKPGGTAQLSITATAPTRCGRTHRQWTAQGFEGTVGSGTQFALQSALSDLRVTVLCPSTAACGDGGPACSTNLITSNSTYAVVSDAPAGTLRQTVNVGNRLVCGSYRFRDPNWYDSLVVPPTSQTPTATAVSIVDNVTYTIRNTRAKGVGFCLGAAYDFTTASGNQAPPGTLPNGNPGFIGLLPRCSSSKPPCIARVSQKRDASVRTGFDTLMRIQIPENGDPWGAS